MYRLSSASIQMLESFLWGPWSRVPQQYKGGNWGQKPPELSLTFSVKANSAELCLKPGTWVSTLQYVGVHIFNVFSDEQWKSSNGLK